MVNNTSPLVQLIFDFTPPRRTLTDIWNYLHAKYFPLAPVLAAYKIVWSRRRARLTLACCNLDKLTVRVNAALDDAEFSWVLEPLLYHEMCHAALGKPPKHNRRRSYHGKEFRALERRHPEISKLNDWVNGGGWQKAVRRYRIG